MTDMVTHYSNAFTLHKLLKLHSICAHSCNELLQVINPSVLDMIAFLLNIINRINCSATTKQ